MRQLVPASLLGIVALAPLACTTEATEPDPLDEVTFDVPVTADLAQVVAATHHIFHNVPIPRKVIRLAAGVHAINETIVLDVPNEVLIGDPGAVIVESNSFTDSTYIDVRAPGVTVEGIGIQFIDTSVGYMGISVDGVANVTLRGNDISGPSFLAITAFASRHLRILDNQWSGAFSGALILGGTDDVGASVEMIGNSGHGNVYGTCVIADSGLGDTEGSIDATIKENDFSDNGVDCNGGMPDFGGGIQLLPTSFTGAVLLKTRMHVWITDNVLDRNLSYGLIVDGDHSPDFPGEMFLPEGFRAEVTGLIADNETVDNTRNGVMFGTAFWASPVAQQIVATKSGACDDSCPDCIDIWAQTPYYHGARYRFTYRGASGVVDYDNPVSDADGDLGNIVQLNATRLKGTEISDIQP